MIVSFAWTTPALLAGAKTVTRRDWSVDHARRFQPGALVDAWDKSPRVGKGKARKVATIRIVREPWLQDSRDVTFLDWSAEGFEWFSRNGTREDVARVMAIWAGWGDRPRNLYVVEFELVEVVR